MKQVPIATRITEHCKVALRSHDLGEPDLARHHLREARKYLVELTDADTLDNAQKLVDAVGAKLNRSAGLNELN